MNWLAFFLAWTVFGAAFAVVAAFRLDHRSLKRWNALQTLAFLLGCGPMLWAAIIAAALRGRR